MACLVLAVSLALLSTTHTNILFLFVLVCLSACLSSSVCLFVCLHLFPLSLPLPSLTPQPARCPLCCSRLRVHSASSISPSPSRQILGENDSPGLESILASAGPGFSSNGIVVQGQLNPGMRTLRPSSSSGGAVGGANGGSSSSMDVSGAPAGIGAGNGGPPKRPPLPPSPRARGTQQQGLQQGLSGSYQGLQNVNQAAAALLHPSSSSSSGPRQDRVLGTAVSSYGSVGAASARSRGHHQQLTASALQPGSQSPVGEGLLAGSARSRGYQQQPGSQSPVADGLLAASLSPAAAAAAATVGEAVAAVAGNPHHPHHQQTMQLLLQHQQHQLQQLQAMQQQQQQLFHSVSLPSRGGGGGSGGASPLGYYAGLGQQSPQSPKVLARRSNSFSR